jgi:hypothetical protein
MRMTASATIEIAQPQETVFEFACACKTYEQLFRKRGSVAGVVKAEMIDGAPPAQGAWRRVELSDGTALEEELLCFDRPTRHTYRWSRGVRTPARLMIRAAEGDWKFGEHDGRTRIDWAYTFVLTTPLVYPAAAFMIGQFRRWMEQQLRAIDGALTA